MGGSVGLQSSCLWASQAFLGGAGEVLRPVWAGVTVVLPRDSDEMPLIIPS
jgi:hypothetical protein